VLPFQYSAKVNPLVLLLPTAKHELDDVQETEFSNPEAPAGFA